MTTMSREQPEDRWQTIRNIWKQNQWLYVIAGFLLGMLFFPFVQLVITDLVALLVNLVPEALSTLAAVFVIDRIYRRYADKERRQELITQMRSKDNGLALAAVEILRLKGWLADGSLKEARLDGANLEGAELIGANLEEAYLYGTNLERATLVDTNLQNAFLWGADLSEANLKRANLARANLLDVNLARADLLEVSLQEALLGRANLSKAHIFRANLQKADLHDARLYGANLGNANLEWANLVGANLQKADLHDARLYGANLGSANLERANLVGANLEGANLTNASLEGAWLDGANLEGTESNIEMPFSAILPIAANFDETTTLPDGTKCTPETTIDDWARFTDPTHPQFWRSPDYWSPAYRGDDQQP